MMISDIPFVKNSDDQCVAGIVIQATIEGFKIYVAWGWEDTITRGHVEFYEGRRYYSKITEIEILEAINSSKSLPIEEAKNLFPDLFKDEAL